jgi:predicted DNA binding CopG/RHH family protein
METQNLTLRVPKTLLQKAKRTAAARGTTVTRLVIEGLTRATNTNLEYEAALKRQRAMMDDA